MLLRPMKFILIGILMIVCGLYTIGVSATPLTISHNSNNKQPKVTINGKKITMLGPQPSLVDGTTFVPSQLFEHSEIQADITKFLHDDYSSVFISNFNAAFSLSPNESKYLFVDYSTGEEKLNNWVTWKGQLPYLSEGDFMVPLREIAERMGIKVGWDVMTNTATLTTTEEFQKKLESPEEWEDWLGNKPIEFDDPSGQDISTEELADFVKASHLNILDSIIIDKYTAVLLYLDYEDEEWLVFQDVIRLRNGNLELTTGLMLQNNEDGIRFRRYGKYLGFGLLEQALDKELTLLEVTYNIQNNKVVQTYDISKKRGMFIEIPAEATRGQLTFFGKNEYTYEASF